MRFLSSKVGLCIEVCLSAYTTYAEMVEGLKVTDSLYVCPEEYRDWWRERGYPAGRSLPASEDQRNLIGTNHA